MYSCSFSTRALCALALLLAPLLSHAETPFIAPLAVGSEGAPIDPFQEYGKRVKAGSTVEPITSSLFGDQVSLYNQAATFSHIDIDMPGNDQLPVQLRRQYVIEDQTGLGRLHGFGEWDLDLPYIHGTFSVSGGGWQVEGPNSLKRCSSQTAPKIGGSAFRLAEVWHGTQLHLPGEGDRELLVDNQPRVPAIGQMASSWITKDFYRVGCTDDIANDAPGVVSEGFKVVTPAGMTYTFRHLVARTTSALKKGYIGGSSTGATMSRVKMYMLVTRIEDRFNNYVNFAYNGDQLQLITAKDGRQIELEWLGNRVRSAKTCDATGKPAGTLCGTGGGKQIFRQWDYQYELNSSGAPYGRLTAVINPDGGRWGFSHTGSLTPLLANQVKIPPNVMCPEPDLGDGNYQLQLTHPSGAMGAFAFRFLRHYRVNTPTSCFTDFPEYHHLETPPYFDNWALESKQISSAALPTMAWSYTYLNPGGVPNPLQKRVTVTNPDGSKDISTFGVQWGLDEGRLLKEEHKSPTDEALRTTTFTHLSNAQVAALPFPPIYGQSLIDLFDPEANRIRPVDRRVIAQQGVLFTSESTLSSSPQVPSYDVFGRQISMRRASTRGFTRTETVTYRDFPGPWVLNQMAQMKVDGVEAESTAFDNVTAKPLSKTVFGRLDRSFSWHADGNLFTLRDAIHPAAELTSYRRGVPRSIKLPTGFYMSAEVNDFGDLTSVTDAENNKTTYGRDAVGRINSIGYPIADTEAWLPSVITYSRLTNQLFGIPQGNWKRAETRGRYSKHTYYDGFFRPVLEHEYDSSAPATTARSMRRLYDSSGRMIFETYPQSGQANYANTPGSCGVSNCGTHYEFDSLNRQTRMRQDSELGLLSTDTFYETDFKTRSITPRGITTQTTIEYQVFDTPDASNPSLILSPEGVTTAISRDVYGKPLSITRSGTFSDYGQSQFQSLTRNFVYDSAQRLCKRIDPEHGASIYAYDLASNVDWSAEGQSAGSSNQCDQSGISSSVKVRNTYDAMNRLRTVDHPNSADDLDMQYWADGALKFATVGIGASAITREYTYNKRRLLERERMTIDAQVFDVGYRYHVEGSRRQLHYPDSTQLDMTPDFLGRPTAVGTSVQPRFAHTIGYHPNDAIAAFTYGNALKFGQTLNTRQLPNERKDGPQFSPHMRNTYTYDANGNLASDLDLVGDYGSFRNASRTSIGYDSRDRLTYVDSPSQALRTTQWGFSWGVAQFTYDALDNIRRGELGPINYRYSYSGTNRLESITSEGEPLPSFAYAYTARGEVRQRTFEGQVFNMTWDTAHRMLSSQNASTGSTENYRYDAHGHRARLTRGSETTWQMYGQSGDLLYSRTNTGTIKRYGYLAGRAIGEYTGTQYAAIHTDIVGTVRSKTNATGTVTVEDVRAPYGSVLLGWNYRNGHAFAGHVEDASSGLTYMKARYYDPVAMRFLSPDPVGVDAATGDNFSRYWYANNNPYSFVDPDGRCGSHIKGNSAPNCTSGGIGGSAGESASNQNGNGSRTAVLEAQAGGGLRNRVPSSGGNTRVAMDQIEGVRLVAAIRRLDPNRPLPSFSRPAGGATYNQVTNRVLAQELEAAVAARGLGATIQRIRTGGTHPHRNDGTIYQNREGLLPLQPRGYYTEYVHPTPGLGSDAGLQRIVRGNGGDMYYSPDHYTTFLPIN